MAIKTIDVKDGENNVHVEYEDDISFGHFMPIATKYIDIQKLVSTNAVDINMERFALELCYAAIKEPIELKSPDEFKKLGTNAALEIITRICESYPLTDFLLKIVRMTGMGQAQEKVLNIRKRK